MSRLLVSLSRLPGRSRRHPDLTPPLPLSEKSVSTNTNMTAQEFTPLLTKGEMRGTPVPLARFAAALPSVPKDSNTLQQQDGKPSWFPQAIAHRGYKVLYPENSMAAFRGAVEIGAHAVETDLHLSKDGVVVLSHDSTLKRCFGVDTKKVADCDWSYLSSLRTVREPKQPMARLVDLLEYFAQPELEDKWILLDIKRDDDATELLTRLAEAIASVPTSRPWQERIILGCWTAPYVKLCLEILPGFPLAYIGATLTYAYAFMSIPNMNFNLLQYSLAGRCGNSFLRTAREMGRVVFAWTVNEKDWMEWCIEKELDGVITDDPKLFLEICDRWREAPSSSKERWSNTPLVRKVRHAAVMSAYIVALCIFSLISFLRRGTPRQDVRKATMMI
ncbi:PLC-like phosphodiesterase [Xylariales sp. PMI_506]|nr:PLC-like phosphodiesterase [Xylariales sp. PMI_506]